MLKVSQAQTRVMESVSPLEAETAPLPEAAGRILAEGIVAARALPPWDNSAMDGYAVAAADCEQPGTWLKLVGEARAGTVPSRAVGRGEAMRIMTGAPLPEGTDAVVMREDATEQEGRVRLDRSPSRGEHVRLRGGDVAEGTPVLAPGDRLGAGEIALLAALGQAEVAVYRRPRVAIVATGDELCDVDEAPRPGQIVNSNAYALAAQAEAVGAEPHLFPILPDRLDALTQGFAQAARQADALITIGGVSVGQHDHVKEALAQAGVQIDFWQVAMQPGRPLAFGTLAGRPVFALPGNPASSMVSFELFVGPALKKMQGLNSALFPPRVPVRLDRPYEKTTGRTQYPRARLRRDAAVLHAAPLSLQGSGMIRSMIGVQALLELPADRTRFEAGEEVMALLLERV